MEKERSSDAEGPLRALRDSLYDRYFRDRRIPDGFFYIKGEKPHTKRP